jgi:hypothetical protein
VSSKGGSASPQDDGKGITEGAILGGKAATLWQRVEDNTFHLTAAVLSATASRGRSRQRCRLQKVTWLLQILLSEYLTSGQAIMVELRADYRLERFIFHFLACRCGRVESDFPINAQVNVTQYHNNSSRDGLYIDSAFTQSAAANLTRDLNFDGTIVGNVYAQPLYIDNGPGGMPTIIAVTESNNVYALDAVDGSIMWQRNLGAPVSEGDLTCPTVVDPLGITGTPIVDLASRALFLNA